MSDINKIYELSEKYQNSEDIKKVEKELKESINSYANGSIGIAQINTIAGDIEFNAKKLLNI